MTTTEKASEAVRQVLGMSLHTWENLMVGSLVLAALVAGIVGIATYAVVQLQRQEISASKDEFERYKLDTKADSDKAHTDIAKANAEAAKANERAAELKLTLEREIADRKPRMISAKQRAAIVEMLKPERIFKGRVLINASMDGEAWQFADQITGVLKEAGFDPKDVPYGDRMLALDKPGAFIWLKDKDNQPKHGGPISIAFARAGIEFIAKEDPSVPDNDTIVIAISSHP